jgi:2-keto-4-pentenoate hydratase
MMTMAAAAGSGGGKSHLPPEPGRSSLVWLANTVGAQGVELLAGHVILPGSITASIPSAAATP